MILNKWTQLGDGVPDEAAAGALEMPAAQTTNETVQGPSLNKGEAHVFYNPRAIFPTLICKVVKIARMHVLKMIWCFKKGTKTTEIHRKKGGSILEKA